MLMTSKAYYSTMVVLWLMVAAADTQPAHAQTFRVLHTFHGGSSDGANPFGQLVRDSAGNLYGTTGSGGSGRGPCKNYGCGTAFKMNKAGKLVWLNSFKGPNGWQPMAGLLRDKVGKLYGTTTFGGGGGCTAGCGVVFTLDKTGKETVLHRFDGGSGGYYSEALLVGDASGNLYGTTYLGGAVGYGTVFKMDRIGKETVLHSFAGPPNGGGDGAYSYSGVIRDAAGSLYGVTGVGGADGKGVAYKLGMTGKETLLDSFAGSDGIGPDSVFGSRRSGELVRDNLGWWQLRVWRHRLWCGL